LIIIWQTYDQAFETDVFTSVKGNNMISVVFDSISVCIAWLSVSLLTYLWLDKEETVAVAYWKSTAEHFLPIPGPSRSLKHVLAASALGDLPHDSLR